jgi:hypothetical protein
MTLCWRKADSNPQSRSEKSGRSATRHMDSWSLGRRERYQRGNRQFESISLQGRVVCEPACWRSWTRRGRVRSRSRARRQKSPPQPRNADYGNEASRSSATTRAPAHDDCKIRWQQTQFVEPRRPGPCAGNRQDAAGNRRCMQGRSRQPCRRRAFPAQADGPHRRARWETLRHIPIIARRSSGHPGP